MPRPGMWDRPEHLDAFLRAVQWGSVTNADQTILEAPFRSGIDLKTYQLEPLVVHRSSAATPLRRARRGRRASRARPLMNAAQAPTAGDPSPGAPL